MGVQGNRLVYFSNPCARYGRFKVSRNGPKYSTSKSNGAIGPIRETLLSTVMIKGIEKIIISV